MFSDLYTVVYQEKCLLCIIKTNLKLNCSMDHQNIAVDSQFAICLLWIPKYHCGPRLRTTGLEPGNNISESWFLFACSFSVICDGLYYIQPQVFLLSHLFVSSCFTLLKILDFLLQYPPFVCLAFLYLGTGKNCKKNVKFHRFE